MEASKLSTDWKLERGALEEDWVALAVGGTGEDLAWVDAAGAWFTGDCEAGPGTADIRGEGLRWFGPRTCWPAVWAYGPQSPGGYGY